MYVINVVYMAYAVIKKARTYKNSVPFKNDLLNKTHTLTLLLWFLSPPFRSFNCLRYTSTFYVHYCETRETQQKHSSDHSVLIVVNVVVLLCFRC